MSDLPRDRLARALEDAIVAEATSLLGAERTISATFDDQDGRVRLFQKLAVVEAFARPGTQVSLDDARKVDPSAQLDGNYRRASVRSRRDLDIALEPSGGVGRFSASGRTGRQGDGAKSCERVGGREAVALIGDGMTTADAT
jgi:NusA N-terminal domain